MKENMKNHETRVSLAEVAIRNFLKNIAEIEKSCHTNEDRIIDCDEKIFYFKKQFLTQGDFYAHVADYN